MLSSSARKRRLVIMFTLTFVYMIAELVVGYWGNSTTLLTDAFHMLSDVIALVIGFSAIHLSPKKWDKNTFGWARMEVLGALVNAVFLLALCFTIIMESIQKIAHPQPLVELKLVLIVGGGGLLLNLVGLCVFHESGDKDDDAPAPEKLTEQRGSLIQNQNRLTRIIVPTIAPSTKIPPIKDENGSPGTATGTTGSPISSRLSSDEPNSVKVEPNKKLESDVAPNDDNDGQPPPSSNTTKKPKIKKNV